MRWRRSGSASSGSWARSHRDRRSSEWLEEGGRTMNNTNKVLTVAVLSLALSASAQVYKYVDKDGKVQYSDHPPDDAKKTEIKVDPASNPAKTGKENWREKELSLNARLADKRRLQEACAEAKRKLP